MNYCRKSHSYSLTNIVRAIVCLLVRRIDPVQSLLVHWPRQRNAWLSWQLALSENILFMYTNWIKLLFLTILTQNICIKSAFACFSNVFYRLFSVILRIEQCRTVPKVDVNMPCMKRRCFVFWLCLALSGTILWA